MTRKKKTPLANSHYFESQLRFVKPIDLAAALGASFEKNVLRLDDVHPGFLVEAYQDAPGSPVAYRYSDRATGRATSHWGEEPKTFYDAVRPIDVAARALGFEKPSAEFWKAAEDAGLGSLIDTSDDLVVVVIADDDSISRPRRAAGLKEDTAQVIKRLRFAPGDRGRMAETSRKKGWSETHLLFEADVRGRFEFRPFRIDDTGKFAFTDSTELDLSEVL